MKRLILLALTGLTLTAHASFVDEYPELKRHLYAEPKSNFYIGLGVGAVGFVENRAIHSLSVFQLHYINGAADLELLNLGLAVSSFGKDPLSTSRHFLLRASPKLRLFEFLSIGPVVGFEWVSFPNASVVLAKGGFGTPPEAFSSNGLVYGLMVSQTIKLGDHQLRLNQLLYKQTYRADQTENGWVYQFEDGALAADPEKKAVRAGYTFLFECAFLF